MLKLIILNPIFEAISEWKCWAFNIARKLHMNCNFDSDEYFFSHQNFDTEDYNGKKNYLGKFSIFQRNWSPQGFDGKFIKLDQVQIKTQSVYHTFQYLTFIFFRECDLNSFENWDSQSHYLNHDPVIHVVPLSNITYTLHGISDFYF